jgi:hypothetical protein
MYKLKEVLGPVKSWPESDQPELAEYAEQIESRQARDYHATPEELAAVNEADRGGVATEKESRSSVRNFSPRMTVEYSRPATADLRKVSADNLAFGRRAIT